MNGKLLYIAVPFTGATEVERVRYDILCNTVYLAMLEGLTPVSSLLGVYYKHSEGETLVESVIETYYTNLVRASSTLLVITLGGWQESKGVQKEIEVAREAGIPVIYSSIIDVAKTLRMIKEKENGCE